MSSSAVKINANDFDGAVLKKYKNKIVFLKFYTNWCGFCKRLVPVYNNLVNYYKNDPNVVIAEYDCEDEKNNNYINEVLNKFKNNYKVEGYPTLVIYRNGIFKMKYNGDRNESSIIEQIERLK